VMQLASVEHPRQSPPMMTMVLVGPLHCVGARRLQRRRAQSKGMFSRSES